MHDYAYGVRGAGWASPSLQRHFLDVDSLSPTELITVLDLAEVRDVPPVLAGRGVGLIFEQPSTRTRHSIEVAVAQLGGRPVTTQGPEVGLDDRESAEDVARTLACYHAVIGARVRDHRTVARMASVSRVPVINLLSDTSHPCQTLADLLTIRQRCGRLDGIAMAYVGDANNVCHSLIVGAAMAGMRVTVATPTGFEPRRDVLDRCRGFEGKVELVNHARAAVAGADVVYTDVWTSMGQEDEADARRRHFAGFAVTQELMSCAAPDALFLHCLPAHRGEEVAASVCDGQSSGIWHQAANRLHTARGLLWWLVEGPTVAFAR